jgi:hypothetical protein
LAALPENANYCPFCGKAVRVDISASRQVFVYLVSVGLPPIGLWYGWKYWRENTPIARKVAVTAMILTMASLFLTIWGTRIMLDSVGQSMGTLKDLGIY